jgi:hypothetical protein
MKDSIRTSSSHPARLEGFRPTSEGAGGLRARRWFIYLGGG